MRKFLSLLLALTLALSLTACGGSGGSSGGSGGSGGGDSQNENVYTLGDYQIEYKGAEIAPDDDGVTSVIVTLGFTNNSSSASRYGFSMYQKAEQAGEFMLAAALNSVSDEGYMKEIEPGETVDVITGFNLNAVDYQGNLNYTDEVKLSIEDADSGKSCTITIDPAALSETDGSGGPSEEDGVDMTGVDRTDTEVGGGYHGSLDWLHYWTGDWYGWWLVTDGTGTYAEWNDGAGGGVWDVCARIEAYEDMTGYMELWDSSGSDADPVAGIGVCFANPDDTEFGVMGCNGGQFIGDTLEEGAWYIDPDEFIYKNIIDFDGDYEDEDGTFSYRVLLRPWGIEWDDMDESLYPEQYYYDWYLPLVESGAPMPDHIG